MKEIYLPWVREVRAMMDEYGQDDRIELLVAGEPYFLAWMLADLVDKWWLFAISIAIVIVVLWLEFRNWRGALFPLIGVGMTIAMTLGLMGFTEFKLTTMMVLTPMLLLAIGIGHSVQVTRRFLLEHGHSGDCMDSGARGHTPHHHPGHPVDRDRHGRLRHPGHGGYLFLQGLRLFRHVRHADPAGHHHHPDPAAADRVPAVAGVAAGRWKAMAGRSLSAAS